MRESLQAHDVENVTWLRVRNAIAAGLVSIGTFEATLTNSYGFGVADAQAKEFSLAEAEKNPDIDHIIELVEDGVRGGLLEVFGPDFQKLSQNALVEYAFLLQQNEDGSWQIVAPSVGDWNSVVLEGRASRVSHETPSYHVHNHPIHTMMSVEMQFMRGDDLSNEFGGQIQAYLFEQGKIPAPPLPPSWYDIRATLATQQASPPYALKHQTSVVADPAGAWFFNCAEENIPESNALKDVEKRYSEVDHAIKTVYSDNAIRALLDSEDSGPIMKELSHKQEQVKQLVDLAAEVGCTMSYQQYVHAEQ